MRHCSTYPSWTCRFERASTTSHERPLGRGLVSRLTVTKRTCKGTTKAGKPCGANPLKPGTVIQGVAVSGDWCWTHDEDLPASAKLDRTRTREQMGGRPKKPTPTEIERRLIEENVVAWQRPYWRTLGYDLVAGEDGPYLVEIKGGGAKLFGESKDGYINVSSHDDLGAMIAASEKLRDRVYGRPKQSSEVTVITQDAIDVAIERMERELASNDRDRRETGDDSALQGAESSA